MERKALGKEETTWPGDAMRCDAVEQEGRLSCRTTSEICIMRAKGKKIKRMVCDAFVIDK